MNMKFDPKKPKVSLRRFDDPKIRLAIKTYNLNRHTQAEDKALENVYRSLWDCYLSEQMPEAALQDHMREDEGFRIYVSQRGGK